MGAINGKPHITKAEETEDGGVIHVEVTCPFCSIVHDMYLDAGDFMVWQHGSLIQDAFPCMATEDRERLITGMCPKCWDDTCGGSFDD